ncbi:MULTISPECIES: dipeptidase [Atopobiaceae]|uniref:Zn-dependent dipeptidase, dipeptidase homolog n=1 Tax=Parafannyhessea umbonata TaxID=604330 RepID=A0A1H9NJJ3_9ACTN|nr:MULTISPECIES: membrane dipeptidase [Atopobiaceae]SEH67919.1 Zn-dependent dipeptidase, dipeptidase homolog [Parafannyhessea umbonata]SER35819.1 Zn-dependent dipeptidase, dipeptidase homolog [Parafannyhessea umbonata]SJZ88110.1 Membrane dipeptidase (Peptidase family M19) [Olsenella sp. KH1P3]
MTSSGREDRNSGEPARACAGGLPLSRRALLRAIGGLGALGAAALSSGCSGAHVADEAEPVATVVEGSANPVELARSMQVDMVGDVGRLKTFDMHCDTVDVLSMSSWEPYLSTPALSRQGDLMSNNGDVSLDRMGQIAHVQGYAIWLPDAVDDPLGFYRQARDWFKSQMQTYSDSVVQVKDAQDIPDVLAQDKSCAFLTVESAAAVKDDLNVVDEMADDGVKCVGLTWNGQNALAGGAKSDVGISDLGRRAIERFEDRKVALDGAHLCDRSFWELMKLRRRPVMVSHALSRSVCDVPRNMTDDMFRAVVDDGGIVGVSCCTEFITKRTTGTDVTFDELMAHYERFLDLGGEKCLCLGGDFDGARLPSWLSSVDALPSFYNQVAARFGAELADDIFFQNAYAFMVRNELV